MESDRLRFWDKVCIGDQDECWCWQAAKNKDGYGSFGYGGRARTMLAHRFAWRDAHGEIPEGMCVLHRCDEPSCVNPKHLFLGTQADNVFDCARKGRRNQVRFKKLSAELHGEIRMLYASGDHTLADLGRRFGVSYQTIRYIVR